MNKTFLLVGLGVGIMAVSAVSVAYAANNNYGAWRAMMGNNGGRATSTVTEKNFDQFTQMHQLMSDGKYEEAQKIRTELGLGQGRGSRGGGCAMGNGTGCGRHNGGSGNWANFVDTNNNGICDHAEQVNK